MDDALPDGVWLGLDFPTYLIQRGRFGSHDKGKLARDGEGYWWSSPMNPYYKPPEEDAEHHLEGEAIHALLLEGEAAYGSRFIVEPDKADYPKALFTKEQIEIKLAEAGVALRGSSGQPKKWFVDKALVHLPQLVVWDVVMASFEARRGKRKPISAQMDFEIRAMWEAAQDPAAHNAEIRKLLSAGDEFPILAEVSIFHTDAHGMKHRARPDKPLPTYTTDAKSLDNWQGDNLADAVDAIIKRWSYDVQLADYQIARRAGFRMILEDESKLHGGTLRERAHVMAMARYDMDHKPNWAWLFFQKPSVSGRAPVLFPLYEPWAGPYHISGHRKRERALQLYRDCMERFGPNKPWSRTEPLHHTTEAHQPHITVSHKGWDENPVEGEDAFFQ